MGMFFQSLGRTLVAGFVLLAVVLFAAGYFSDHPVRLDSGWARFAIRWTHVLVAMMWVGLLWYFNFVQIPSMPRIPEDQKAAITKVIAPTALLWFRWAAVLTVATGLVIAWLNNYLLQALLLAPGAYAIGVGMWLGLVMAFNVWFVIWPNQKRALGLVPAPQEARARAARVAMVTSRVNTMLSIPMLYCMVGQSHGGF